MELLESSGSWIIALGKTLLNSLWLGFILLSLLKALFLLIPQRLAVYRYHAALFSMLLFVGFSFTLFVYLYSPVSEGSFTIKAGGGINAVLSQLIPGANSGLIPFYYYISFAYMGGMGIYFVKTLSEFGKIKTLRRNATGVTGIWRNQFETYCKRAGVRSKVDFLVSEGPVTPFLTGVIKPAIIVPSAMFTQLSFNEVEAILMHELYHLKRLDHWVNLIQNVVELLFFFNPAIRLLSEMISSERERCCDDRVLEGQAHPLEYARALYQISNLQNSSGFREMAAAGNDKGQLKSRIERILKPNVMKINIREKSKTLLIFLSGIAIMILVSGFTSGLSITRYQEVPIETQEEIEAAVFQNDTLSPEEKQQLKTEIQEAMAEIDWEEIKKDIGEAKIKVLEEINWEEISRDIEEATRTIEVDIDWEEIKKEMDEVKVKIDLLIDDLDMEMDFEIETEIDIDTDMEVESDPDPAESL